MDEGSREGMTPSGQGFQGVDRPQIPSVYPSFKGREGTTEHTEYTEQNREEIVHSAATFRLPHPPETDIHPSVRRSDDA